MTDLVRLAMVRQLLAQIDGVEDELAGNERDMVAALRKDFEDPSHNETHAVRLLETILRNVRIRRGYGIDAGDHERRRIDLERKLH